MQRLIVSGKIVERADVALALGEALLEGLEFDVRVSTPEQSAIDLAEEAVRAGVRRLVAVGGDGTIHEVVQGLFAAPPDLPRPVVGVVPCGTANDFAAQFDLPPTALTEWLKVALVGPPRRVDLGRCGDHPFVNMATIGVPAEISAETRRNLKDVLGKLAYTAAAIGSLATVHSAPLAVTGPGIAFEGETLAVVVANGRQAGGGFVLAPDADLHDGLLDVLIIPAMGLAGAGVVASGALFGGVDLDSRVVRAKAPWVEVKVLDGAEPVAISLDGEVDRHMQARFSVAPGALALAAPEQTTVAAA